MTADLVLNVRLTPRAARDQISGLVVTAQGRQAIAVRVRAVPENGKANRALIQLLAKFLGVAKSHVEIVAGGKSRLKTVRVAGERAPMEERIAQLTDRQTAANGGK